LILFVDQIIVGMKADLESDRKVSKEEVIKFCEANNAKYFECSAKTGQNVDEAMRELVRVALPENGDPHYSSGKHQETPGRCNCM
jgi:GTPase SAR1 family protein